MNERAHSEKAPDLEGTDQRTPAGEAFREVDAAADWSEGRSGLLAGRRKFLVGTVGFSAFAATLASRPALAHGGGGGGGGCGPITALCSPTHSGSYHRTSCVGWHADYWCNNRNLWPVNCNTATFSSCGFNPPPGCNFSGSQKLKDAICSAYGRSSAPTGWNQSYGLQESGYNTSPYNGGWWSYNSSADTNNLACWIACGLLNAMSSQTSGAFGYDRNSFNAACTTALHSKNPECYTSIHVALCATISSICTQHKSSSACGGHSSIWS